MVRLLCKLEMSLEVLNLKVKKGEKIISINGAIGDVVEDFQGGKFLITGVDPINGMIVNNYHALRLDDIRQKAYLYDRYLVANYGRIDLKVEVVV